MSERSCFCVFFLFVKSRRQKKTHARPVVRDLTINHHRSSIIIDCDASRHHVGGAMIAAQLQV